MQVFGRKRRPTRPFPYASVLRKKRDVAVALKGAPLISRPKDNPTPGRSSRWPLHSSTGGVPKENGLANNNTAHFRSKAANEDEVHAWDRLKVVSDFITIDDPAGTSTDCCSRDAPSGVAFDLLRTRLLAILGDQNCTRVAISAPTPGSGSTYCAVNLALSLARVPDSRIILMDMNQRNPGVATALGLDIVGDMSGFLSGRQSLERHVVRIGQTLAVGLADAAMLTGADRLNDPGCRAMLDGMIDTLQPDVVIYDLPAMLHHDELEAILPQVDGVLLIADGSQTSARDIKACEKRLRGKKQLLGVVLNRSRSLGSR